MEQKQEPKEKMYTLSFTRAEILERIDELRNRETLSLYLKVQQGEKEATELQQLMQLISE